jgi:hypothetical protein
MLIRDDLPELEAENTVLIMISLLPILESQQQKYIIGQFHKYDILILDILNRKHL